MKMTEEVGMARFLQQLYLQPDLMPVMETDGEPYQLCLYCGDKARGSIVMDTVEGLRRLDLCDAHLTEVVDIARAAGNIA